MILTLTLLPSVADTHGSHRPKVKVPFVSTAPREPSGSRFSATSQRFPLDTAKKHSAGVGLQTYEARILCSRGFGPARRLWIAGKVELVHHLSVQGHQDVGAVNRDLIIVPFADGAR